MIFKESMHWYDGMFLQPHHMQQMQNSFFDINKVLFNLNMHYPFGLIECELNEEFLDDLRLGLKHFSAVMPNGICLSMPGNTSVKTGNIDVNKHLYDEYVMVYLTLPIYDNDEANLNSKTDQNRLYDTKEYMLKDENAGNNEIMLLKRIFNATISTTKNDNCTCLPIARLTWISKNPNSPKFAIDKNYCPPFLLMSHDCLLKNYVLELMYLMRKKQIQIKEEIASSGYNTDNITGANLFNILQLSVLNAYEPLITSLLQSGKATPFEIYLHLISVLGRLSALFPLQDKDSILEYDHYDLMNIFKDVVTKIRSVLAVGGYLDYIEYKFELSEGYYIANLKAGDIADSDEFYIAINAAGDLDKIKNAVEGGDNFRLLAPSGLEKRSRGVKLKELRYTPRYLPAIRDAVWFEIVIDESANAWQNIQNEHVAIIDLLPDMFDEFKASLFMVSQKEM